MLETIEAFKAGRHRATNGTVYEFSAADVAAIAASYDPAVHAAPIVLGHPKSDDPAWGWAKSLTVNDAGVLVATPEKIDPAFAEGVDAGRYRYVSASLYAPTDDANPKPGSWYLRHLGFLGAQPPAVKGLAPAFAEDRGEAIEFAAADGFWVKDLFRGIRDFFIEKFGLDEADKVIPSWAVDAVTPSVADAPSDYAEGDQTTAGDDTTSSPGAPGATEGGPTADAIAPGGPEAEALTARAAELDAREAALDARDAQFSEAERTEARAADTAFVDGLVTEGRLPPAQRDRTLAVFARLGGDASVAFAEADADPRAELRALLGGLGVSINFSEVVTGDFDVTSAAAAPAIAERISEIRTEAAARGEHISFSEAAQRLPR